MSLKDRFKNNGVTDDRKQLIADRWSNPDELTARINKGMNVDLAALQDWFGYCRFKYPSIFRGWTIEQFKDWNEERIAALDREHPPQTYDETLAEIEGNCLKQI